MGCWVEAGAPSLGALTREMGLSRWGNMDRPKLGDQHRGLVTPVLTIEEPESSLSPALWNEEGVQGRVGAGCQCPGCVASVTVTIPCLSTGPPHWALGWPRGSKGRPSWRGWGHGRCP